MESSSSSIAANSLYYWNYFNLFLLRPILAISFALFFILLEVLYLAFDSAMVWKAVPFEGHEEIKCNVILRSLMAGHLLKTYERVLLAYNHMLLYSGQLQIQAAQNDRTLEDLKSKSQLYVLDWIPLAIHVMYLSLPVTRVRDPQNMKSCPADFSVATEAFFRPGPTETFTLAGLISRSPRRNPRRVSSIIIPSLNSSDSSRAMASCTYKE
ncbi:hypothetical protein CUMW_061380 [Citrus unshiu]|uniref:Uncharacterized protein n=1 Tax=Citrus unshiu TaxID=55188 RepID=A0A2H5NP28_CITUN|nr:hypothetical protein CUMW_061380 [Citrus unshiu]